MTQPSISNDYKQGYSAHTLSTHQRRTAALDAAFLLPHLRPTDRILDLGCGPGTITLGFAPYVPEGHVLGVDVSAAVVAKAQSLADAAVASLQLPAPDRPGAVTFAVADVFAGLPYPDASFDAVFASQVFGHFLPSPAMPLRALEEIRRVLKPGGVLATRDAAAQHFFPASAGLDRLWVRNLGKALRKGVPEEDGEEAPGASMGSLLRRAGFDVDGGKVQIGAGTQVFAGRAEREFLAQRGAGQLKVGDAFYQSWLDAGISEEEIRQTVRAVETWAATEDAWYASLQCEALAWK